MESLKDTTKACEFYEKLLDFDPNNTNALQKLAIFRDSIGDYTGAFEYISRLKQIDSRSQFVSENFEKFRERAENGGGLMSFFKTIFGRRMG